MIKFMIKLLGIKNIIFNEPNWGFCLFDKQVMDFIEKNVKSDVVSKVDVRLDVFGEMMLYYDIIGDYFEELTND